MPRRVLRTPLCDLLDIEYPVLLAGMWDRFGRATPPPLVAAVSNAGGMGVMALAGLEPEECRQRIRRIRELTDRPFGVDVLMPAALAEVQEDTAQAKARVAEEYPQQWALVQELKRRYGLADAPPPEGKTGAAVYTAQLTRDQVEVALEERVPAIALALGDASWLVERARREGVKVIGMAGSVRHALRHVQAGVDAVVAQGSEAGGHVGRISTLVLVPQVVDAVGSTPVVAAGGIGDGRAMAAVLALGAQGVWCGTLFLTSQETGIPPAFQDEILAASSEEFVVTKAYTGKPARDYRNPIIEEWERSGLLALPMPLQGLLLEDFILAAERAGRYDLLPNAAGQVGGMLRERRPAGSILEEMVDQCATILKGGLAWNVRVG